MDSKSLVFYDKNGEYDDITRNIETVILYNDPLRDALSTTSVKSSISQDPARNTNSLENLKECNELDDTQSTRDKENTIYLPIDKENTSRLSLSDEYKYCKDVISYITTNHIIDNSEHNDSVYRNVNDVLVFTVADGTSCSKMNETKSENSPIPCNVSKDFNAPKPCNEPPKDIDGPKPCNTPKDFDGPKPCNAPKYFDGPKPFNAPKDFVGSKPCNTPKDFDGPKPCNAAPKDFDASKPCNAPKDINAPTPCNTPKHFDGPELCNAPKGFDDTKPCNDPEKIDAPKPCDGPKSCSKRVCQSKSDIASSPSSWSCSEKTSKSNITCCPKKSDSSCNIKSTEGCSNKCSRESCKSPESQLSDCIMGCVKSLEDKKSAVDSGSHEPAPCPNKTLPTSSFQNFVESSAATLATFKTSVQDFIGTVCNKTRETTKFITDEGYKFLGFKEKPKCNNENCKACNSNCTEPRQCDFSKENDPYIEKLEVKTGSIVYEDVSCKSSTSEATISSNTSSTGVLEDIIASKIDKSSKYDIPTIGDTDISFTSLLGNIKDKIISFIISPFSDNNCKTDETCHSGDITSRHIIIIKNNQGDEGNSSEGKACEDEKFPAAEK